MLARCDRPKRIRHLRPIFVDSTGRSRNSFLRVANLLIAIACLCGSTVVAQPGSSSSAESTSSTIPQSEAALTKIESALDFLKKLRDDPDSQLTDEDRLTILQWQLRFGQVREAETTFNQFPGFVVASDGQFPFVLNRKLRSGQPDRYLVLERFIRRPTLQIPADVRQVGLDRIQLWRVFEHINGQDLPKAIRAAKRISVSPENLTPGRRHFQTSDYLCVEAWKQIFAAAVSNGNPSLAQDVLSTFHIETDVHNILTHQRDKIARLPESDIRTTLLSHFASPESSRIRVKRFKNLLKVGDFESAEIEIQNFDDDPAKRIGDCIALLEAYHRAGETEAVERWLDRVVQSAARTSSRSQTLARLFAHYDRIEDAIEYFGDLQTPQTNLYSAVATNRQPLCELAFSTVEEGNLLRALEIANAIENPVFRSATYSKLASLVEATQPQLANEWWQESLTLLAEIDDDRLHDACLRNNLLQYDLKSHHAETNQLLDLFKDRGRGIEAMGNWLARSVNKGFFPTETLYVLVDLISESDSRHLENVADVLRENDRFDDCLYVMLRMREDTEVEYFSYVNLEFKYFFEFALDRLTRQQIATIFSNQLPKHRGIIMARCLNAADDSRKDEIVELIAEHEHDTDIDLRLHNALAKHFILRTDLNNLRLVLEKEAPSSQFLDDDPVSNDWNIGNSSYEWLPPKLAKKIGSAAMLEFARSVSRSEPRQIAFRQALLQVADDDGLQAALGFCDEFENRAERSSIKLRVTEYVLSKLDQPVKE